jgi:hypothetical protein
MQPAFSSPAAGQVQEVESNVGFTISAVMTDMSVSGAFVRSESQPAIFSTVWVGLARR